MLSMLYGMMLRRHLGRPLLLRLLLLRRLLLHVLLLLLLLLLLLAIGMRELLLRWCQLLRSREGKMGRASRHAVHAGLRNLLVHN